MAGSRLKNKIAIVTGAGSGIGRACAIALAREGCQVALVGRRKERLEETAHEIGDSALVLAADASKKDEIARVVDDTIARFAGLNVLLNNAGVLHIGTVEQITDEQWDETLMSMFGAHGYFLGRCFRPCERLAAARSSTWLRCSALTARVTALRMRRRKAP